MEKIIVCTFDSKYIPEKKTPGAVCWDMRSTKDITIKPGEIILIPTGVKISLPHGWGTRLYARSSSPIKRGYMLANGVGIIDADYRGEYLVQAINVTKEDIVLEQEERIMQLEFAPFYVDSGVHGCGYIPEIEFIVDQDKFDKFDKYYPSDRGARGFGSTGRK